MLLFKEFWDLIGQVGGGDQNDKDYCIVLLLPQMSYSVQNLKITHDSIITQTLARAIWEVLSKLIIKTTEWSKHWSFASLG